MPGCGQALGAPNSIGGVQFCKDRSFFGIAVLGTAGIEIDRFRFVYSCPSPIVGAKLRGHLRKAPVQDREHVLAVPIRSPLLRETGDLLHRVVKRGRDQVSAAGAFQLLPGGQEPSWNRS